MSGQAHEVNTSGRRILRGHEPGVVAALEPELDVRAGLLHAACERDGRLERFGQRLLAQDVATGIDRRFDRDAVQFGWRGDDDGLGRLDGCLEGDRNAAVAVSDFLRPGGIGVDDVETVDTIHGAQQVGVHAAHAACADDGDVHRSSPRSA